MSKTLIKLIVVAWCVSISELLFEVCGVPFGGYIFIIIIGIQPLGRSGQRPKFSQATGMALVRCILGKFLGVACHCLPPLFRCSHFSPPGASTSATTWEILAAEVGTVGRECCLVILPKWRLPRHLEIFYMPQIYDMGPTALLPPRWI